MCIAVNTVYAYRPVFFFTLRYARAQSFSVDVEQVINSNANFYNKAYGKKEK